MKPCARMLTDDACDAALREAGFLKSETALLGRHLYHATDDVSERAA